MMELIIDFITWVNRSKSRQKKALITFVIFVCLLFAWWYLSTYRASPSGFIEFSKKETQWVEYANFAAYFDTLQTELTDFKLCPAGRSKDRIDIISKNKKLYREDLKLPDGLLDYMKYRGINEMGKSSQGYFYYSFQQFTKIEGHFYVIKIKDAHTTELFERAGFTEVNGLTDFPVKWFYRIDNNWLAASFLPNYD